MVAWPNQAHAGDENGDGRGKGNDAADLLVLLVLTGKRLFEELVLKGLFGCHVFPDLLQNRESVVDLISTQPHQGSLKGGFRPIVEKGGFDRIPEGAEVEVLCDADDGGGSAHAVASVLRQDFPTAFSPQPKASARLWLTTTLSVRSANRPASKDRPDRPMPSVVKKIGVNGKVMHCDTLSVCQPEVIGTDAGRKLALQQGYAGHARLGKSCLLEAFANPRRIRTAKLDNDDLISRVSKVSRLDVGQLLMNRDGAEDQEDGHAVLQSQKGTRHLAFSTRLCFADDRRGLHARRDQGRVASRRDADQHR